MAFFSILVTPLVVSAAVVTIDSTTSTDPRAHNSIGYQTVFVSDQEGYTFYRDSTGRCVYAATADGGTTWGTAVTIDSQIDCIRITVWYDKWTPGGTGDYVHILTMDTSLDDLFYNRLDTTSDTLLLGSSPVNISTNPSQNPTFTSTVNLHSITKATDGVIYAVVTDASDSYVVSCSSGCDSAVNWAEVTPNPLDIRDDYSLLLPLTGGDIMLVNRDTSANIIRSKVWDGISWDASWTTIQTGVSESFEYDGGMAATVDTATGNIYLAYTSDNFTLTDNNDDIYTAVYDGTGWTTMADVLTNESGRGILDIGIGYDQIDGHVYVVYTIQDSAGVDDSANIYYKESTDGMTTWSSEQGPVTASAGNLRKPSINPNNSDRMYVTWWEAQSDDRFGETIENIGPDTTVSAAGALVAEVRSSSTAVYAGGSIQIESLFTNTLSSITLTENGTIDASTGLENIELYYDLDTSAPYDCTSETYDGTEPQFGSTVAGGFSGPDGTVGFSGEMVVLGPSSTFCGYVVYDTAASIVDGRTIGFEIADPPNDISITGSNPSPTTNVSIPGTSVVRSPELTQTHYHWRNDDGTEIGATSATGGVEDEPLRTLAKFESIRLRVGVEAAGATTSMSVSYQLEYTYLVGTCAASTGWVPVNDTNDAFKMQNSVHLTDGDDTTNISVASGGVSDGVGTFLTNNTGVRDVTDVVGGITLDSGDYTEFEFSVVATSSAVEGTTYCFRVTADDAPLPVYDTYPQVTINADITATTTGAQIASVSSEELSVYTGGSFVFIANDTPHTLSSITLTENGTIDASTGLENIELYYDLDTSAPYDCTSETYDGTEPQFGSTVAGGFSGPDGTVGFSDTLTISPTSAGCFYIVTDVTDTVISGETIAFRIESPTTDVSAGGASIAPSSPVVQNGQTTVITPVLAQTHYHWRNDDGTEIGATSATGGVEDEPLVDKQVDTPIRLRMQISNEGATSSELGSFALEYTTRVSSCAAATGWEMVESQVDGPWELFDSDTVTHGASLTNIPVSAGGVTDENSVFSSHSESIEVTATTSPARLTETEFVEYEFSLRTTLATAFETTYCFRLTFSGDPLPRYDEYPIVTTAPKRDFRVQRGTTVVTGTDTTITAGVDYTAPNREHSAFIRITNTNHTGAGDIVGSGSQDVEEVTVYISNPDNLSDSVTFSRNLDVNQSHVDWEIVEFIGQSGTDNEMIVRDVGTVSFASNQTSVHGASVTVDDAAQVAVYVTGVKGADSGNDFFSTQVTSEWDSGLGQPVLERGATGNAGASVSYAVVEYTGLNWQVQRVEHTYTSANTTETQAISPVTSLSQAFIHAQKRLGASAIVASHGHEVFLSSVGAVSFRLPVGANMSVTHTSVAWVIENTQPGTGAMQVERQSGSTRGGSEPLTLSISLGTPVQLLSNSSIFGNSAAEGTNTAHPRSIAGLLLASTSAYELFRSDTGTDLLYRTEVVQWPTANLTFRQNYYRLYVNNNLLTPSDPWPAGPVDLGENTSITAEDDPPGIGDVLRLRMTVQARNANWPPNIAQFSLQFAERVTTCSAVSTWTTVGGAASSTVWRGFVTGATTDGTPVSSDPPTPGDLVVSVADVAGTLEHENNTASNTYRAFDGEDVEYDWQIQHNGATADTSYCFRMVEADGSQLAGYLQYPQVRTADFTPTVASWRWYSDHTNETPTNPLAATAVAPINVAASTSVALRIAIEEAKQVPGTDVRFKMQFSEDSTFASTIDVQASSTCASFSNWCYTEGGAPDNTRVSTTTLPEPDTCTGGIGDGCGTHNSANTYVTGHVHPEGVTQEYSFTIESTLLRPNVVYYFRLFDIGRNTPVPLGLAPSPPAVVSEGAQLQFTVSGLDAGIVTAGETTDVDTTATGVPFGVLPVNDDQVAGQRITIDTNATEGYRVFMYSRSPFISGSGAVIPPITSTNESPQGWGSACDSNETGCVGYHTTDSTLSQGSTRFGPTDTYAAFTDTPREIMYSSIPTIDTHDVLFRVLVTPTQTAGNYQTDIVYLVTPIF